MLSLLVRRQVRWSEAGVVPGTRDLLGASAQELGISLTQKSGAKATRYSRT